MCPTDHTRTFNSRRAAHASTCASPGDACSLKSPLHCAVGYHRGRHRHMPPCASRPLVAPAQSHESVPSAHQLKRSKVSRGRSELSDLASKMLRTAAVRWARAQQTNITLRNASVIRPRRFTTKTEQLVGLKMPGSSKKLRQPWEVAIVDPQLFFHHIEACLRCRPRQTTQWKRRGALRK